MYINMSFIVIIELGFFNKSIDIIQGNLNHALNNISKVYYSPDTGPDWLLPSVKKILEFQIKA